MYALMITSSQLKLLVHALFYVLPIWRNEVLRDLTNYYNSSKTLCEDTSKHTFSTEGTLRILSRKLSLKHFFKDRTLDLNKYKKNAENLAFCNNINRQYQTKNNVSWIADI